KVLILEKREIATQLTILSKSQKFKTFCVTLHHFPVENHKGVDDLKNPGGHRRFWAKDAGTKQRAKAHCH
ncbi:MAG: hypothetical protein AAGM67_11420, partial [Bacteroidota bacterium]